MRRQRVARAICRWVLSRNWTPDPKRLCGAFTSSGCRPVSSTPMISPRSWRRVSRTPGKKGSRLRVWNRSDPVRTSGILPRVRPPSGWFRAPRAATRVDSLKRASISQSVRHPNLQTHCGFIPETPSDPLYGETVQAVREVAQHAKGNGQAFLFETGQENPITLVRIIRDVGLDNVGVGLDTANLILYGKANPLDALDVLGKYVRTVHAKDGLYPTDPNEFGQEVPIGKGKVDFPASDPASPGTGLSRCDHD